MRYRDDEDKPVETFPRPFRKPADSSVVTILIVVLLAGVAIGVGILLSLNLPEERSKIGLGLLVGSLLFWCGGEFLNSLIQDMRLKKLSQQGEMTTGQVIQKLYDPKRGQIHFYRVNYVFDAPLPGGSPQKITNTERVSTLVYDRLQVGDALDVQYLPQKPKISRPIFDIPELYHKVRVIFGEMTILPEDGVLVLSNPECEQKKGAMNVLQVYLETCTTDTRLLERFITYLMNYPPVCGFYSVQVYYRGNLNELGSHLENSIRNAFAHIEEII